MTEKEIGELWRKPENYMKPLAFGAALSAAVREECAALALLHASAEPVAWIEGPHGAIRANPTVRYTGPATVSWSVPLYALGPLQSEHLEPMTDEQRRHR